MAHLKLIINVIVYIKYDFGQIDGQIKEIIYKASAYNQIIQLLKHSIFIAVICKVTLFTFPLMILHTVPFMDYLTSEIYLYLFEQGVIFEMTPLEIEAFCRELALKVIANSPKYPLMFDLLPDIIFDYIQTLISYILLS